MISHKMVALVMMIGFVALFSLGCSRSSDRGTLGLPNGGNGAGGSGDDRFADDDGNWDFLPDDDDDGDGDGGGSNSGGSGSGSGGNGSGSGGNYGDYGSNGGGSQGGTGTGGRPTQPDLIPIYRFHIDRRNSQGHAFYLDHQFSTSATKWVADQVFNGIAFYVYAKATGNCNVPLSTCWGVTNHPGQGYGHTATVPGTCPPDYDLGQVLGYVCAGWDGEGSGHIYSLYSWDWGSDQFITISQEEYSRVRATGSWIEWYGHGYWTPGLY